MMETSLCAYRAGVPGRLVPVGYDCASRRGAVSRGSAHSRSEKRVEVGSSVLARPSGRRGRLEVGRCRKRALFLLCEAFQVERRAEVGSGRRSSSARPSGRRLDRPSGLSFRYFGPAQELRVVRNVVCWVEPLLGSRSMRDPGFMNPTSVVEKEDPPCEVIKQLTIGDIRPQEDEVTEVVVPQVAANFR